AQQRIAEFRDLTARFQQMVSSGDLSIHMVDGRMVVQLPSDVLFASGSARLSAAGQNTIRDVAKLLIGIADKSFQIEGHTDNVPVRRGTYNSNWELSAARAISVAETMIGAGMAPERLSIAGFADTKPLNHNENEAERRQNRRIEVVLVPDLSLLPGATELESL